jgi:hypothetical protein
MAAEPSLWLGKKAQLMKLGYVCECSHHVYFHVFGHLFFSKIIP